ncbi:MAG TPA: hypothetical protein VFL57_19560 [Bryobacteraceae bacterium]|nr:hypothetical protein [Bryobacteraceae bacterium]
MRAVRLLTIITLLGTVSVMPVWAAEFHKGSVVVIQSPATVFSKPLTRDRFAYRVGDQRGTLAPGTRAIVEEEVKVRTVLGEQVWLRVSARHGHHIPEGWINAKSVRPETGLKEERSGRHHAQ